MFSRGFDVVTIGTATRDVFLASADFKTVHDPAHLKKIGFLSGEAQCFALGGKIEVGAPVLTVGGGAANAAVTMARMGLRAACAAKIGRDENGAGVAADLARERVTPCLIYDAKEPTAYSVVLLSGKGERTVLHYRGASRDMRLADVPRKILKTRWAYIVPGNIPFPVIAGIVKELSAAGARIAMNPSRYYAAMGPKKLAPLLKRINLILANREEASLMTGIPYDKEAAIFRKFDELVDGLAVLTDGAEGSMVSDGKILLRAGIFKEKRVADRTGAGDAFGSGFVAALAKESAPYSEETLRRALAFASANATSVVEHVGAQAGILTRRSYESQRRFRKLKITTHKLS